VGVAVLAAAGGGGAQSRGPGGAVAVLDLGDSLGSVTGGWGDAWANDRWGRRVVRVDGRTGRVEARVPVGGRAALGRGAGAMWAVASGGGYMRALNGPLLEIDPATNRVTARIPLRTPGGEPVVAFGVQVAAGAVWVWGPRHLLRIDPRRDRVDRAVLVYEEFGELTGVVAAEGWLLATTAGGQLVRYDAHTGLEVGSATLAMDDLRSARRAGTHAVVRGRSGGLALVAAGEDLLGVDIPSGRVAWRRELGFRVGTVLESGGVLWVQGARTEDAGDRVWALDPATGTVRGSALLPAFGTNGMAAIGDALWVSAAGGRLLVLPAWLPRWLGAV
jgi:hypothetical protein